MNDSAALERIARALADGDASTQEVAASACRRLHGRGRWPEAAQADLVRALGAEHGPEVRWAALISLGRYATIPGAGSALRRLMEDDDARLREHARFSLRRLGNHMADWSEEVRSWAEDSDGPARCAALDAYAVHHSLAATGAAWLTTWLDSEDEAIRVAAAGTLAREFRRAEPPVVERALKNPRFIAGLHQVLLHHPDDFSRGAAAACLVAPAGSDSVRCLLLAASEDASAHVRREACLALETHPLDFEAARSLVMREIERARQGKADERQPSLGHFLALVAPHGEATDFVLEELARETVPESSMELLRWLGGRTCAASFDAIAEWVRLSPEQLEARCGAFAARHREAALEAVAARPRDAHTLVPELLAFLGDAERDATERDPVTGLLHHPRLVFTVIEALTGVGVTSADVRAALHTAHRDGDEYVRRAVLVALGTLGADEDTTVDMILDGLAADDPYSPNVARDALVKLGARLADRLTERRRDPARSEVATRALAFIGALPAEEQVDQEPIAYLDLASHQLALREGLERSGSSQALALALLGPSGTANSVVSPLSVALMLHFLRDVVRGVTYEALPNWLRERAERDAVTQAVTHLRDESVAEFRASMGLFVDPETPLHAEFERGFEGHLDRVPLQGTEALPRINGWAHEQSNGLIPALLSELPDQTRCALVQLTYFSGRWMEPLTSAPPGATISFHTVSRAWRPVACMAGLVGCRATQAPDYEAIELPYEAGSTALLLVVPADGTFLGFRTRLDAEGLDRIVDGLADEVVSLVMPRFSVQGGLGPFALSAALGLDALFATGDLSGMTPLQEVGASLQMLHAATLRAHELGTDAAAATATFHIGCSARHATIDRPFLFFLRHRETGVVLFAGQVTDPIDP